MASDGKKSGQMKKINKFYIASLHLEEVFGFHCQVVSLTEELPSAGLPESSLQHLRRQLDAYQAAVTRLDDLLSADTLSPLSKQVIAANKERGRAWRGLNNFAKAMKACPEASVAAAAGRAKAVIDKYGNPTYLPQLQERKCGWTIWRRRKMLIWLLRKNGWRSFPPGVSVPCSKPDREPMPPIAIW